MQIIPSLYAAAQRMQPERQPNARPKLFKEQRDVLDQAKAVDAAQRQQSEAQRKTIEQQAQ